MPRVLTFAMMTVALIISGCGFGDSSPSDNELAKYAEARPALGKAVDFWFYTHCGIENARIGGVWWQVNDPLYGANGPGDSPDGWGNPYQKGRLTVLSADKATFEARGVRVALVPAPSGVPLRICA